MPSPFPGMDPYLEGDDWTSFHAHFAAEIARQLTPKLRPKYIAMPQKRFDIVDEDALSIQSIYPDVGVADMAGAPSETINQATLVAPFVLETVMEERAPHTWIEIRNVAARRLVGTIEILSPWNKRGAGRDQYLEKRQKLLHSLAHLIEIDLLRRGHRLPMKKPLPPGSYYVFLSRSQQRPMLQVWPIALDQVLPTIPVPLLPGDAEITLDLQAAFENVYDLCGFDIALDYTKPPSVPLLDEQGAWVAERLRASGK